MSPELTVKALNVLARCSDDDMQIRPRELGRSVTQAIQEEGLSPDDLFSHPR